MDAMAKEESPPFKIGDEVKCSWDSIARTVKAVYRKTFGPGWFVAAYDPNGRGLTIDSIHYELAKG